MQLSEKMKGTHWILFFNNFHKSPALIDKLFQDGIYARGKVWSNQKHMPKLKEDKKMSSGESDFHHLLQIVR